MNVHRKEPSVITENPTRKVMYEKEVILETLRGQGFRITKQRIMVINIILENDCSCCKEIYYQANKIDPNIGIATIYRMIKTLEDIGAINRKNQYKVSIDKSSVDENTCDCYDSCMVILKNNKKIKLNSREFNLVLRAGLDIIGFAADEEIDSIVL